MLLEINTLLGSNFFVKEGENLFVNIHKNIVYDVELFHTVANKGRIESDPVVASNLLIQALELNHADYLMDTSSYWTLKIRNRLRVERINLIYRLIGHLKQLQAYDLIQHYRSMVNQIQNDT